WNPKMRKFIFAERNGIYIIDLKKTARQIELAQSLVRDVITQGNRVLFVCTKRQLRGIIQSEAERSNSFFVTERWLGGMLTNFTTIKKQIRRLRDLERGQEEGAFEFYTKKERLMIDRERAKLEKYLAGVKDMARIPGALFVVDARKERIAVSEANKLGIPVIAIADTNADPDLLTVPIAGNDDAIRSVSLIARAAGDAIIEARASMPADERRRADEVEATVYSSETGESAPADDDRKGGQKRRPRRKRRPRPEVIANLRGSGEEEGEGD
ncbi:MAG: 30S ribosomal protein S2, partial [Gemmatimonadota bacterium]